MKAKKLKALLLSGDYDHLTVKQFANLTCDDFKEEFDIDVWAEDFYNLFAPNNNTITITHHTNRTDK